MSEKPCLTVAGCEDTDVGTESSDLSGLSQREETLKRFPPEQWAQPFWHQEPVWWKIIFPQMDRVGRELGGKSLGMIQRIVQPRSLPRIIGSEVYETLMPLLI